MRKVLSELTQQAQGEHAGLVFDRYLSQTTSRQDPQKGFDLNPVCQLNCPEVYRLAYERWTRIMEGQAGLVLDLKTSGPLALGLGNASVTEVGLSSHHTYGVPVLPASGLKGLARKAARDFSLTEEQKAVLFGDGQSAAHLTLWDGWMVPSEDQMWQKDILTVHHGGYYRSRGETPPTDFDDPNPVAFICIPVHTCFQVAITSSEGPERIQWLYLMAQILKHGLETYGLGAKTQAGYGFFTVRIPDKPKDPAEELRKKHEQTVQTIEKRLVTIKPNNARNELDWLYRTWTDLPDPYRQKIVVKLHERLKKFGSWNNKLPQFALLEELLKGSKS